MNLRRKFNVSVIQMNVELPHLLFRWLHVLSGVMWVGQLWSLVLVQRLLPREPTDGGLRIFLLRVHNWHRWAATLTWITGIPLLGIVYYGGGALTWPEQSAGLAMGVGFTALFVGWILYDAIWIRLARAQATAAALSFVLFIGAAIGFSRLMTGRAMFIHLGAMMATIMLGNIHGRIWPAERRRLTAGIPLPKPSSEVIDIAASRLRHNAALAVAVILFMVSNHFPLVYGHSMAWLIAPGIVSLGWLLSRLLYVRTVTPSGILPSAAAS